MNKTRRNWLLGGVLATALAASAGIAGAQATGSHGRHGGFGPGMRGGAPFLRALDLTDAQKSQVREIFKQAHQANAATRESLKAIREEEQAAVKAGKSEADFLALANQAAPLMAKMHASELAAQAKVYALLTPEQRDKAEKMHAEFKDRAQNWRQHREKPAAPQQ